GCPAPSRDSASGAPLVWVLRGGRKPRPPMGARAGQYPRAVTSPPTEVSQAVAELGGDLDAVLGEVQVAAGVADRDGIVRWQNARALELCGDCVGRPLATMVAPESSHHWRRQFSKKVLGTARTTDYRMNMIGPDGSHVPIEVSSIAIEGT